MGENDNRRATLRTHAGAWWVGRRADDALIRERHKFVSGWAKFGLAGLVIGALFLRQDADRREAVVERTAERVARATRDAAVAAAFDRLSSAIDKLSTAAEQERDACTSLRERIAR